MTDDQRPAAAPRAPAVPLLVQRTPRGLRIASPLLPGWVAAVHGATDIARALDIVLREAELLEYARARGQVYDAVPYAEMEPLAPTLLRVRRKDGSANWRRGHHATDWTPLEDGRWQSPGGLVYGPDTQVVRRVIAALEAMGEPSHHPDAPEPGDQ